MNDQQESQLLSEVLKPENWTPRASRIVKATGLSEKTVRGYLDKVTTNRLVGKTVKVSLKLETKEVTP